MCVLAIVALGFFGAWWHVNEQQNTAEVANAILAEHDKGSYFRPIPAYPGLVDVPISNWYYGSLMIAWPSMFLFPFGAFFYCRLRRDKFLTGYYYKHAPHRKKAIIEEALARGESLANKLVPNQHFSGDPLEKYKNRNEVLQAKELAEQVNKGAAAIHKETEVLVSRQEWAQAEEDLIKSVIAREHTRDDVAEHHVALLHTPPQSETPRVLRKRAYEKIMASTKKEYPDVHEGGYWMDAKDAARIAIKQLRNAPSVELVVRVAGWERHHLRLTREDIGMEGKT
jgi:hypothetical protein